MFVITMPVTGRDGAVRAILVCGTRLSTNQLVDDLTRPSSGGHDPVMTVVTDAGGLVISHPQAGRVLRPLAADPRFARVVAAWKARGAPIDPQGSSERLDDDIVAYAGVPDADWVVFRSAPAELLLGGPLAGRSQATWIGAAVAVAGGGIILGALLWLLRPLRQLERRALRLLEGDLAPEAGWPHAGGELGQLVRVFRHAMKQQAAMRAEGDALFEKMRAVMATAPAGIAFTRLGRFELVSEQFGRLFGYDSALVPGLPTHVLCPSTEAHAAFLRLAAETFAGGRQCDVERELVRSDSSRFWARMQGAPVRQGDPQAGTIWIFTDITESRRQREQLSWSASHDALTGLVNRREFELRLAEQLAAHAPEEPAAALFIDLDRFKAVNDAFGHAAGDALLKDVAGLIGGRARAHDTVARLGGDEFAVLLRGCTRVAAERVAAEICALVGDYRLRWPGAAGDAPAIGASVGVVAIEPGFASVEALLHAADLACYEAKRAGRGTVRVHRPGASAGRADAPDDEATLQD
jgi:diguanylate cyclase (GGDEF)-like protein/PAS domain S-box-containing protein